MKLLLFTFLCLVSFFAKSQIILIRPSLGNCNKCMALIKNNLDVSLSRIPTYFVFSESNISDSNEINSYFPTKDLGIRVLYNDNLLNYFKQGADFIYLDHNGELKMQKLLFSLSEKDIALIKSEYQKDYKFKLALSKSYRLIGNDLLQFDNQLHYANLILNIDDPIDTINFKFTAEIDSIIRHKTDRYYPGSNIFLKRYLEKKPKMKQFFNSKIMSYSEKNNKFYFGVETTILLPSNSEDTLIARKFYSILKFKRDKTFNIFPINLPHNDTQIFLPDYFLAKNDSTLLFLLSSLESLSKPETNFIAEFVLKEGAYIMDHYLTIPLPKLYKRNDIPYSSPFTYTCLKPNMISYPYFITLIDNKIIDLEKKMTNTFKLPSELIYNSKNDLKVENAILRNQIIVFDQQMETIYIIAYLKKKYSLLELSSKDYSVKKIVSLEDYNITRDNFLQVVPEKKLLFSADKDGLVRGYPLYIF